MEIEVCLSGRHSRALLVLGNKSEGCLAGQRWVWCICARGRIYTKPIVDRQGNLRICFQVPKGRDCADRTDKLRFPCCQFEFPEHQRSEERRVGKRIRSRVATVTYV